MSFRIHALSPGNFKQLFGMSDSDLEKVHAARMTVDAKPGFPCRVSLVDAEIGETVILVNFQHQPESSPYRSAHALFVREQAQQAFPEPGEVPEVLRIRQISIRAFDARHFMVNADVVGGEHLEQSITAMFENPEVAYIHLHNAKPGCFAASVTRA